MRKFRKLTIFSLLLLFSLPVNAEEIGIGNIKVGETSCEGMHKEMAESGAQQGGVGISAITMSDTVGLKSQAFGFEFVRGGRVICGQSGVVEAIHIEIFKSDSTKVADALAQKYRQKSYNLPLVGSGKAEFVSESGESNAIITYEHVSFDANIFIVTPSFLKAWQEFDAEKEKKEKAKTKSAF